MTIEIAEDWFDNNISGQEGFTLDSENEVYRKTISEADLTFQLIQMVSFERNFQGNEKNINLDFQILS